MPRLNRRRLNELASAQAVARVRSALEAAQGAPAYILPQLSIVVDGREALVRTLWICESLGAVPAGPNRWRLPALETVRP